MHVKRHASPGPIGTWTRVGSRRGFVRSSHRFGRIGKRRDVHQRRMEPRWPHRRGRVIHLNRQMGALYVDWIRGYCIGGVRFEQHSPYDVLVVAEVGASRRLRTTAGISLQTASFNRPQDQTSCRLDAGGAQRLPARGSR